MGSFTVRIERGTRVMRIHLRGLLSLDDVARLAEAQAAELRAHALDPHQYAALINIVEAAIQPGDVAAALDALSDRPDFRPTRLAFVCGNSSAKMQARRVNAGKEARYFGLDYEAIAWLQNAACEDAAA